MYSFVCFLMLLKIFSFPFFQIEKKEGGKHTILRWLGVFLGLYMLNNGLG